MAKAKRLMANRIKIMALTALSKPLLGVGSAAGGKGSVISIKFCRLSAPAGA